jgi:hypothetical protein
MRRRHNHEVTTNGVPRGFIDREELTPKEKEYFDWVNPEDSFGFFRFHGEVYHLSQFERISGAIPGWDGFHPTSISTGVLIKIKDEQIIVGSYQAGGRALPTEEKAPKGVWLN